MQQRVRASWNEHFSLVFFSQLCQTNWLQFQKVRNKALILYSKFEHINKENAIVQKGTKYIDETNRFFSYMVLVYGRLFIAFSLCTMRIELFVFSLSLSVFPSFIWCCCSMLFFWAELAHVCSMDPSHFHNSFDHCNSNMQTHTSLYALLAMLKPYVHIGFSQVIRFEF